LTLLRSPTHSEGATNNFTGQADPVAAGKAKLAKGDQKELAGLFDLFDKFDPNRNYKIPPLEE